MRVVFAGTPEFAVPTLAALVASRHEVVGVLTQPDRPAGRGRKLAASPIKDLALTLALPVAQPATLRTEEGRAALHDWQPDVLVVVAYGLILPREALALPRHGCINVHASLLPRWRGAAPIQRALLAGDVLTGVTIMQMEAGLDTGPMLAVHPHAIEPGATAASLTAELAALGASALIETLDRVEAGTARATPQPAEGVTYAHKLEKSEAWIDWRGAAPAIERQVRAFDPWPVAQTKLGEEVLRIHAAHAVGETAATAAAVATATPGGAPAGSIAGLVGDALQVRCGAGLLAITALQRAGRRTVSAREFAGSLALAGQVFG